MITNRRAGWTLLAMTLAVAVTLVAVSFDRGLADHLQLGCRRRGIVGSGEYQRGNSISWTNDNFAAGHAGGQTLNRNGDRFSQAITAFGQHVDGRAASLAQMQRTPRILGDGDQTKIRLLRADGQPIDQPWIGPQSAVTVSHIDPIRGRGRRDKAIDGITSPGVEFRAITNSHR